MTHSYSEPAPPYRGHPPYIHPPSYPSELELTDLTPYVPSPSNRPAAQPSRERADTLPLYTPYPSSLLAVQHTPWLLHSAPPARPFAAGPVVRMRSLSLLDVEKEEQDLECVITAGVAVLMVAGIVIWILVEVQNS